MQLKRVKKMAQSGFTLVELIIVIVILGILSAVAIPKLSDTSDSATIAVQDATLGALKSAWSIAYANAKGNPSAAEVVAQMTDPACQVAGATFTCNGVYVKGSSTTKAAFGFTADATTGKIASPSNIVVPTTR